MHCCHPLLKSGIHLLALTETWADSGVHDGEFAIPGYKLFRRDGGATGGGIAVYVKNEITATRRDDVEDSTVEGLWLEISLPKTHGFLVGTFYRPPNSSKYHDKDFMIKLESMFWTRLLLKVKNCSCWAILTVNF